MLSAADARMSQGRRGEGVVFADTNGLRVHLIGVGGAGMMGAAALLRDMGSRVSGSDLQAFEGLGALVERGVRVAVGHSESQLDEDVELVVTSAAVPESNPELSAARRRGTPVLQYAELLGALMAVREGVAVAGTHGKSTTTALTTMLFRAAGLSPSFVVGARSAQLGGSSGLGAGPHFIVESCEFNRSFLQLRPRLAAVLNIEPDHLDCFRDLHEIVEAFAAFCASVHPAGLVVANADDAQAMRAASAARCEVQSFGFSDSADWTARRLETHRGCCAFEIWFRGAMVLRGQLGIPGRYNVGNALAAVALAHRAGASPEPMAAALGAFSGVDRRLTLRAQGRGFTLLDDYAHHPTEIRVTIEAALLRYEPKRLRVVFQPHQVSRTRHFMAEFAEAFSRADEVLVPPVYGARESDESACQAASRDLVETILRCGGRARYCPALREVVGILGPSLAEGDLVLTMGAGDVWKVADELVERIFRGGGMRRAARAQHVVSAGGAGALSVPAA